MANQKYKCTNYGVCKDADHDVVFNEEDLEEVDGEYICPTCKQKLELIDSKRGGTGKKTLIAIIAAVLVIICAVVAFLSLKGRKAVNMENDAVVTVKEGAETIQPEEASVSGEEENTPGEAPGISAESDKQVAESTQNSNYGTYSLEWGTYEGPIQNGVPNGVGGQINVTKSYSIDLKDMSGSSKTVDKGDKIVDCKFKDGKLVQGYIHHSNGQQESLLIGG